MVNTIRFWIAQRSAIDAETGEVLAERNEIIISPDHLAHILKVDPSAVYEALTTDENYDESTRFDANTGKTFWIER